jgi:hypothetical protein
MLSHNLCGVTHEGPRQAAFIVIKIKHRSTGYTVLLPHVLGVGGAQLRLSPPAASRHTAQLTSSVTGAKKKISEDRAKGSAKKSQKFVLVSWIRHTLLATCMVHIGFFFLFALAVSSCGVWTLVLALLHYQQSTAKDQGAAVGGWSEHGRRQPGRRALFLCSRIGFWPLGREATSRAGLYQPTSRKGLLRPQRILRQTIRRQELCSIAYRYVLLPQYSLSFSLFFRQWRYVSRDTRERDT